MSYDPARDACLYTTEFPRALFHVSSHAASDTRAVLCHPLNLSWRYVIQGKYQGEGFRAGPGEQVAAGSATLPPKAPPGKVTPARAHTAPPLLHSWPLNMAEVLEQQSWGGKGGLPQGEARPKEPSRASRSEHPLVASPKRPLLLTSQLQSFIPFVTLKFRGSVLSENYDTLSKSQLPY